MQPRSHRRIVAGMVGFLLVAAYGWLPGLVMLAVVFGRQAFTMAVLGFSGTAVNGVSQAGSQRESFGEWVKQCRELDRQRKRSTE